MFINNSQISLSSVTKFTIFSPYLPICSSIDNYLISKSYKLLLFTLIIPTLAWQWEAQASTNPNPAADTLVIHSSRLCLPCPALVWRDGGLWFWWWRRRRRPLQICCRWEHFNHTEISVHSGYCRRWAKMQECAISDKPNLIRLFDIAAVMPSSSQQQQGVRLPPTLWYILCIASCSGWMRHNRHTSTHKHTHLTSLSSRPTDRQTGSSSVIVKDCKNAENLYMEKRADDCWCWLYSDSWGDDMLCV